MSDNRIRSIFKDRSGVLWIGTDGGGLNKFNRESGEFTHYTQKNSRLSNNFINIILN
ncbi:MAG: hypothetical protein KAW12_12440 [Candidatus Aminicenantes bacterium]|nr:hypothetical protein [Candidatus Aminicenantes bacterium]